MPKARPYPEHIALEVAEANREGRPVDLTEEQMKALGHTRSVRGAITAFCRDCMGGSKKEVERCTSVGCALYPLRIDRG